MSASTEKKLRKEARETGTDKKAQALQKQTEEQARSKRRWTLGTMGVILLIVVIIFLNSGLLYTATTAMSVGSENYSPAEMSYRYASQYMNFVSQYGSYASMFGLDTSNGYIGLDEQSCSMIENGTWKDYFMQSARDEQLQVKALSDYAAENGITATDEELTQLDASIDQLTSYAKQQGYSSAANFLSANYGTGVNVDVVYDASLESVVASKAYQSKLDSLKYTDAQLEEEYKGFEGSQDVFGYAYYTVEAEKVTTTAEDGTESSAVTEETMAAALETAGAIQTAYEALEGEDRVANLSAAVAEVAGEGEATETRTTGANAGVYSEWLKGGRSLGDIAVVENSSSTGYSVAVFLSYSDNHYKTAQVRHILVKAVADENGEYTDEAKATAKAAAEDILKEYKAGDKTEDSFAALAGQYSEDGGSNTNGGLYDSVYKGQMVEEFEEFCFAGHKKGDTAIVYGESSSYAGYHVMYYVGEGELYSDYLAKNSLQSADMTAWVDELTAKYEVEDHYWLRLVG